jgi:hypothetical protein
MEASYQLTPTTDLDADERVTQSFHADRSAYIREHTWIAAFAMALGMGILWAMGNPHVWTGAVGGLAAILIRGLYVASDELKVRWDLTNKRLLGPQTRAVALDQIKEVKTLGTNVQIITKGGDKHLMKYQADRDATRATLKSAAGIF